MTEWDPFAEQRPVPVVVVGETVLQPGDRVWLRPKGNADAFDVLLAGHIATIESIEQDFEDRIHLAVTVDDDPGKDLGVARKIAHRFFFAPDEVEPFVAGAAQT